MKTIELSVNGNRLGAFLMESLNILASVHSTFIELIHTQNSLTVYKTPIEELSCEIKSITSAVLLESLSTLVFICGESLYGLHVHSSITINDPSVDEEDAFTLTKLASSVSGESIISSTSATVIV